ncbi:MAG TPA: protein kinase [Tepidisphaeraceae bacterium]|nr:protein kinase [Tepidisphaeraceae bacterium]
MSVSTRCRVCGKESSPLRDTGLCDECDSRQATTQAWSPRRDGSSGTGITDHPTASDSVPAELGSVKLLDVIGRGANGVVYRGYDRLLDRPVAVKLLQSLEHLGTSAQERFLDEARAGAAVHHPNLVEIHQAGIEGRLPYLILQYIDGQTLAQVLHRRGRLSIAMVGASLEETAAAVEALHRQGIIHRDLKPSNLLLDREGHVHVSDLGVCVRRQEPAGTAADVAGTPAYMAPELFEGRASARADIYALGVTLFELLTGELPFIGSLEHLREKHHAQPLPAQRLTDHGAPADLIDVIERACHKQAHFRYKTAEDLARAFIAAAGISIDRAKARLELAMPGPHPASIPAAPQTQKPTSPVQETIPSTIARLAEVKRSRHVIAPQPTAPAASVEPEAPRASVNAPEPQAPAASEEPEVPRTINGHLPCLTCGYDLRSLTSEGCCPECGLPITQSLDSARIVFADARWLDIITIGHGLVFVWLGLCVMCMLLNTTVRWAHPEQLNAAMFHTYYEPSLGLSLELNDAAFGIETAVCLVPLTLGIWLATLPRRNWRSAVRHLCRAVVMITLALAVVLAVLALSGISLHGWVVVPGLALEWQGRRGFGLGSILAMLEVTSAMLLLWYFGILVRSIPEPSGDRKIRWWALVLLSVSIILLAVLNPAILPLPGPTAGHPPLWTTLRLMVVSKLQSLVLLAAWALFLWSMLRTGKLLSALARQKATDSSRPVR